MNVSKRRNIVARVMAADNINEAVMAEAKRAGVSTRTIERWVEAAKKAPSVGQVVTSETVPTPQKPAENKVLDALLKDEGQPGKAPEGPPTAGEVQSAAKDAEQFCVEAYSGIRSALGSVLVSMRYTPPLDASSPEVLKLLAIGKPAELAIRMNAPRLYPILVKYASNWGALLLAIGADAMGMLTGLQGLAKSKGWEPKEKESRSERYAGAVGGSPKDLAAQINKARADLQHPVTVPDSTSGEMKQIPTTGTINAPSVEAA